MADVVVNGNLVQDVELRYTNTGKAVANLVVAVSERYFDKKSNEWKDTDPWFARCTIWGEAAEHANHSLHKGIRVIGHGKIKQRSYEVEGQKRTSVEVELYDIGASLKYGTTAFTKAQRGGAQQAAGATQSGFVDGSSGQGGFGTQEPAWSNPGQGLGVQEESPF